MVVDTKFTQPHSSVNTMSDIRSFFAPKNPKSSGDGDKSPPPKKVSKAETDDLDRAIRVSPGPRVPSAFSAEATRLIPETRVDHD
jgi:hypothetical protein